MTSDGHRPTGRNRPEHPPGAFATTQWSLIARAGRPGLAGGRVALERLCREYWYPVYCFASRQAANPQDAADLTQGFFADLLARDAIVRADASRGRFRTFLLCAFQNYCSHERARAGARKRGGGSTIVSIEALEEARHRVGSVPTNPESPEQLFDRRWALRVIDRAMASVRSEYAALGKGRLYDELQAVLKDDTAGAGYAAIAERLDARIGAIKVAAFRLRRRLAAEIRAEVAETVADPAEIDAEMRHLLAAVGR
jgi:RNA polymerase sigma-70 factor (ECF subfamily)